MTKHKSECNHDWPPEALEGFTRPSLRGRNEKWEDMKALQSDFLKTIYSNWCGNYDGSIPAQLAEFMNLSYDCGFDQARKDCKGKLKHLGKFYKKQIEREVYLARKDEREKLREKEICVRLNCSKKKKIGLVKKF